MVSSRQILARWKKLAGDTSPKPWADEDDLAGFFENFRPTGKGIEAVFEDVQYGDEILPRLQEVFKASARSSPDAPYFIATPAKPPTESAVEKLLLQYWKKLSEMAQALEDDDAMKLLAKEPKIKFVRGELPESEEREEIEERLRELVMNFQGSLKPKRSHASLLEEGLYTMATTYAIPDYVLWPLYREATDVEEPFQPAFELWKRGVEFGWQSAGRIVATIAEPVDERESQQDSKPAKGPAAAKGQAYPEKKAIARLIDSGDLNDDDFYRSSIEDELKSKPVDLDCTATFLAGLGRNIGGRGILAVLQGDPKGWSDLYAGWKYLAWQYRAQTAVTDGAISAKRKLSAGSGEVSLEDAAVALSAAMALRQDAFAQWCGQRLVRNFTRGDVLVNERKWDETPFEPFMVRLFAKWRGVEETLLAKATDDLVGKFAKQDKMFHPLLTAWNDPERFGAAFRSLCDLFSSSAGDNARPIPYCVFPADLLAIARVRADLGLGDPAREHPLFKSSVAQVPEKLPISKKDALFDRVVVACSRSHPKLSLEWQW